jgi:hypothetical protein
MILVVVLILVGEDVRYFGVEWLPRTSDLHQSSVSGVQD